MRPHRSHKTDSRSCQSLKGAEALNRAAHIFQDSRRKMITLSCSQTGRVGATTRQGEVCILGRCQLTGRAASSQPLGGELCPRSRWDAVLFVLKFTRESCQCRMCTHPHLQPCGLFMRCSAGARSAFEENMREKQEASKQGRMILPSQLPSRL